MWATFTQMFSIDTVFRWVLSHEDASEMQWFVLSTWYNWNIFVTVAPRRRYPYFDVVVGPAWSNDPEIYADGHDATGMASRARQVKGDGPDKKGYPGPPGWGLGVRLTVSPRKTYICWETSKIGDRTETTTDDTAWTKINNWRCGTCCLCMGVAHGRTVTNADSKKTHNEHKEYTAYFKQNFCIQLQSSSGGINGWRKWRLVL